MSTRVVNVSQFFDLRIEEDRQEYYAQMNRDILLPGTLIYGSPHPQFFLMVDGDDTTPRAWGVYLGKAEDVDIMNLKSGVRYIAEVMAEPTEAMNKCSYPYRVLSLSVNTASIKSTVTYPYLEKLPLFGIF